MQSRKKMYLENNSEFAFIDLIFYNTVFFNRFRNNRKKYDSYSAL